MSLQIGEENSSLCYVFWITSLAQTKEGEYPTLHLVYLLVRITLNLISVKRNTQLDSAVLNQLSTLSSMQGFQTIFIWLYILFKTNLVFYNFLFSTLKYCSLRNAEL